MPSRLWIGRAINVTVWPLRRSYLRIPLDSLGSRSRSSPANSGSMPDDARGSPRLSNDIAPPPPVRRIVHSRAPRSIDAASSLTRRLSRNARRPSSSETRHSRRSQAGGAKLTYRSGTIASTTACSASCVGTLVVVTRAPARIKTKSRIPTRPAKPRLSDRSRHACTLGRPRATSQKRTIGSITVPAHAMISATAIQRRTGVGAESAIATR